MTEASTPVAPEGAAQPESTTAPSGRRQAFRDIRRQLSNDDLMNPGVQKLLLEEVDRLETQCETLGTFRERFHQSDKRVGILEEKLKAQTAVEIFYGVGLGVGGAIVGLAPNFWTDQPKGWLCLTVGLLLMIGASIGRAVKQ